MKTIQLLMLAIILAAGVSTVGCNGGEGESGSMKDDMKKIDKALPASASTPPPIPQEHSTMPMKDKKK